MPTFYHRITFQRYFDFPVPPEIDGREVQFVDIKEGNPYADDIILVRFDLIGNGNYIYFLGLPERLHKSKTKMEKGQKFLSKRNLPAMICLFYSQRFKTFK